MFKVKRIDTEQIYMVLDTYCEPTFHQTYFLIWDNDGWRWRPSDRFVPPSYEEDLNEEKK